MGSNNNPAFQFRNNVSPHYLEPLFLRLTQNRWYSYADLRHILNESGLPVQGRDIVQYNAAVWSLVNLVETRSDRRGRSKINHVQLTLLGKQIIDTYGTNQSLFYDLIHFLFYSSWQRSLNLKWARFWLYERVCDVLWDEAPAQTDLKALTIRLQSESHQAFPDYRPSFPSQSVAAVFPWLGALQPAFLSPCGNRNQLCSERRSHCTPQLFHLAVDLLYTVKNLRYGTALAVSDEHIQAICRTCLLDTDRFWSMAELTQMSIRGFEIKRGQWATSIALAGPPTWISLPDFTNEANDEELEAEDEESEGEDEQ